MLERVSIINGTAPIIIISPHSLENKNTDIFTEHLCKLTGAHGIINRGWKRANKFNWKTEEADCNNLSHCHEDVVRQEFLDPIKRIAVKINRDCRHQFLHHHILKWTTTIYMFVVHGVEEDIQKSLPGLDVIVGGGEGIHQSSFSCAKSTLDLFLTILSDTGLQVYEGMDDQYSGMHFNELNQLFIQWHPLHNVNSMKIEISPKLRLGTTSTLATANIISGCIKKLQAEENKVTHRFPKN